MLQPINSTRRSNQFFNQNATYPTYVTFYKLISMLICQLRHKSLSQSRMTKTLNGVFGNSYWIKFHAHLVVSNAQGAMFANFVLRINSSTRVSVLHPARITWWQIRTDVSIILKEIKFK